MRRKLRILFTAFEAAPFLKTGGLGDVAGALPPALRDEGNEVRVMLPLISSIPSEYQDKMTHVADFRLQLGWRDLYCGVEQLQMNGITWYFIDNEYYFMRDSVYGFYDDGERVAFFSKAVAESLPYLPDFKCDVIHCNDWHTALVPIFLMQCRETDPAYENVKTVFTVHNLKYQGIMPDYALGDMLGFTYDSPEADLLRSDNNTVNLMQGGLLGSDLLTTVSPTYAEEVKTPFCGEYLEGVFQWRAQDLTGILNGIDPAAWDPASDPALPAPFSAADLSGKALCKAAVQRELGLEEDPTVPLVIMVGRLIEQKGLDLLRESIPYLLEHVQLAVLGTGDPSYEQMVVGYALGSQGRMSAQIRFDEGLARRMYAGADLLIMPSLFEPCGIAQLIAMRYGTLPVVRETGGLKDTVLPYEQTWEAGTGFAFPDFSVEEFCDTVMRGAQLKLEQPEVFNKLVVNAMSQEFTWAAAARRYTELYASLHPEVTPWKRPAKAPEKKPAKKPAKKASAGGRKKKQ